MTARDRARLGSTRSAIGPTGSTGQFVHGVACPVNQGGYRPQSHIARRRISGPSAEGAVTSSDNRRKSRPALNEATWGYLRFDNLERRHRRRFSWARVSRRITWAIVTRPAISSCFPYRTQRPTAQTLDGEACPGGGTARDNVRPNSPEGWPCDRGGMTVVSNQPLRSVT